MSKFSCRSVQCSVLGDFRPEAVEILVFPNTTGDMFDSSGFFFIDVRFFLMNFDEVLNLNRLYVNSTGLSVTSGGSSSSLDQ